jgi:hypothetical protein
MEISTSGDRRPSMLAGRDGEAGVPHLIAGMGCRLVTGQAVRPFLVLLERWQGCAGEFLERTFCTIGRI